MDADESYRPRGPASECCSTQGLSKQALIAIPGTSRPDLWHLRAVERKVSVAADKEPLPPQPRGLCSRVPAVGTVLPADKASHLQVCLLCQPETVALAATAALSPLSPHPSPRPSCLSFLLVFHFLFYF